MNAFIAQNSVRPVSKKVDSVFLAMGNTLCEVRGSVSFLDHRDAAGKLELVVWEKDEENFYSIEATTAGSTKGALDNLVC